MPAIPSCRGARLCARVGEADGTSSGRLRVVPGNKCASSKCLAIGGDGDSLNGKGLRRGADLTGYSTATLSFSVRRHVAADDGATVSVQVSDDGGATWATATVYELSASDPDHVAQSFDISAWIAGDTQIRFLGSGPVVDGTIYVDDVEIELDGASGSADDTFGDDFNVVGTYAGDDGSRSWSGPWVENDDGDPANGSIEAGGRANCFGAAFSCLSIHAETAGEDVYREADLSGAATAALRFYFEHALGGGDQVVVEVSADGGASYTVLKTFDGAPHSREPEDSTSRHGSPPTPGSASG